MSKINKNLKGVTLTIKDNSKAGLMVSFDLPRLSMNEALDYIATKLKSWRTEPLPK